MPVTLAQWTAHKRGQRNPLWPSSGVFWNDVAIFAVVCAGTLSVSLVGSLPGDEIVVLILLPFLIVRHGKRAFRREYVWFYILLGGWLFGTIGGDLYLGVSVGDKLKGIARVVFLGLDFVTLAILVDRKVRNFVVFLLADAVLLLGGALRFGAGSDFLTQWKFGLDGAVGNVVFLAAAYYFGKRRYSIAIAMAVGMAALNLIFAVRSQIAVDLMAAVLVLPIVGTGKGQAGRALDGMDILKLLVIFLLVGGAAYGANEAVKYAAARDWFNENIEAKFEAQSAGKLGVLVGGRPETLVAIQAIRDSPIIGHGSFAQDPSYVQMMQDLQYQYGYTDSDDPAESLGLAIPTHSHLTQAWVESGILGGIFWIYILVLLGRMLVRAIFQRPTLMPIYAGFAVGFTWDVLYSPMGSTDRLVAAFVILMCYDMLHAGSGKKPVRALLRSAGTMPRKRQFRQLLPSLNRR